MVSRAEARHALEAIATETQEKKWTVQVGEL